MDRRTLLTTIIAPILCGCEAILSKDVTLSKDFFDLKNVIDTDSKIFYYKYELKPGKTIVLRIDSTKIKEYDTGNYTLQPSTNTYDGIDIYDIKKKK